MSGENQDIIVALLSDILGSAPAVVAILFLIYRMESREQTTLNTLLRIVERCFRDNDEDSTLS